MNASELFDEHLRSWLDEQAEAEIPMGVRDRTRWVMANRQPRPRRVAAIGSHWITEAPSDWRQVRDARVAIVWLGPALVLAMLAALALLATAILVGALKPPPSPAQDGRLLFDQDGDIVLAKADGTAARVIVDGALATDPAGSFYALVPEVWAPDGEHFVYYEYRPTGVVTHIADATGRTEATFLIEPPFQDPAAPMPADIIRTPVRDTKATNLRTWWSPDSTMLAVFPWDAAEVTIYGRDGRVVTSLPLPIGYGMSREAGLSGWMPDGRSVLAVITSKAVGLRPEVWQLALDGSPARQVPDGHPFVDLGWSLSPDGRWVAFSGHVNFDGRPGNAASPYEGADTIYVAEVDGGKAIPVAGTRHFAGVTSPLWSPDGTRILYTTAVHHYRHDLHVVDVASGNDQLVATVLSDDWAPHAWSPAGDTILVAAFAVEPAVGGPDPSLLDDGTAHPGRQLVSLWRVEADGTNVELLAHGLNYFGVTN